MPYRFVTPLRLVPDRLLGWLPIVFLLAAGPLTAFLAIVVPPGEVADEVAHIARADSITHFGIVGFRHQGQNAQGGPEAQAAIRADEGLVLIGFGFLPGTSLAAKQVTLAHIWRLLQFRWQRHIITMEVPNTAVYPPTFYIPAAIAICVARGSGVGPYSTFLAARLTNAVLYTAIGAYAISMARRGRVILLCLLGLPMSLSLAASVNQDGLIIATVALSSALLTRPTRASWWAGAVLLGFAAMAKPYLAVLAFALPVTYPGQLVREALGGFLIACVPAALWTAAMTALVATPFVRGPAEPAGPLWDGPPGTIFATTNPMAQLHVLLASPLRLVALPYRSLLAGWEHYWREFIGVLGSLDVLLPEPVYRTWAWIVILAVAGCLLFERQPPPPRTRVRCAIINGIILFSLAASSLTAFILQYLSWTRVGTALIDGVQGRYFIPVAVFGVPLLQLAGRPRLWNQLGLGAVATAVSVAVMSSAVFLMLLTVFAYYTR